MKKLALTALCLLSGLLAYAQSKGQADLSLNTIAIDAGHGGKDAGTISSDRKTYEKAVTLEIAKKFAEKVQEAYPKMNVVLTRSRDEFVPLNLRAKKASNAGAQLFISIHINASAKGKGPNGFSAFILGTSDRYNSYDVNMEVCKRENSVIYLEEDYSTKYKDLDESSPESQIFLKLMQNAFREQSLSFAETVCHKMSADGPFRKDLGVLQGNFQVLREASMPAVLLEFGFMSNDEDLKCLRNDSDIDKIISSMLEAFIEYKKAYDQSVSIGGEVEEPVKSAPKASQSTEKKSTDAAEKSPAPEIPDAPSAEAGIYYGTQVLASSKSMDRKDRFFMGYEMKAVRTGTLYKYILCPESDLAKAKEKYKSVKDSFPDSFLVKVENGEVSRLR